MSERTVAQSLTKLIIMPHCYKSVKVNNNQQRSIGKMGRGEKWTFNENSEANVQQIYVFLL